MTRRHKLIELIGYLNSLADAHAILEKSPAQGKSRIVHAETSEPLSPWFPEEELLVFLVGAVFGAERVASRMSRIIDGAMSHVESIANGGES